MKLRWLIVAGMLVAIFEFLSLAGIKLPPKAAILLFTLIIFAVGHKTLMKGARALAALNFRSINLLMMIAVAGAFYLGEYEEAAIVIVLFTLAEKLEDIGVEKSRSSLDRLLNRMPSTTYLKGKEDPVPVSEISVGDVILIKPYQTVPLDGEVVDGQSFVDESAITGEPIAQDKRREDRVFAGTVNKQGVLEVKVTKKAEESTYAKIRDMTFDAMKHKAPTQKFIETFSLYYTPTIILLAIVGFFVSMGVLSQPLQEALGKSLTLLVIACPCALVISTPIAIFSAIGNASSSGVLIKGGRYLEAIGQVKAIAFDKTRTLTYGEPLLTDVIPFGKNSREELLSCAAGVELFSEHPLAQSVVEGAKREDLIPHRVEGFESILGKGAKADCLVCYDRHHCIGKLEFILEEHHVPEDIVEQINALQSKGKTVIVISTHQEVEGIMAIEDEIRQEAPDLIAALRNLGIHSVMLTGDHPLTANAVAEKVGISAFRAELLPKDKVEEIKKLAEKHGVVAMVGDGVNDAPALASANVGISMTTLGSDTAIEAASIVILSNHLKKIPYLITLGRRTLKMIRFNTSFAVGIKFLFVGLALTGLAGLALAIFADVGVTLLVILNSLRLLRVSAQSVEKTFDVFNNQIDRRGDA